MKPLFLLLLGLTLLVPATHAQDDDAQYDEYTDYGDEYADEMEIMRSLSIEGWAHEPALPVHASTSKGPMIADFARAFLKQKRYSSSFSRAILARLDGHHPEPDNGMSAISSTCPTATSPSIPPSTAVRTAPSR